MVLIALVLSAYTSYAHAQVVSHSDLRRSLLQVRQWREYPQCGDSTYWSIVKLGKPALPALIELIGDSSKTSIDRPCSKEKLTLGDLAFKIVDEIISLPLFEITRMQFCVIGGNCDLGFADGYLDFVARDRQRIMLQVKSWYEQNDGRIKEKRLSKHISNDCRRANAIDHRLVVHEND